jgi:hypothetical protein
MTLGSAFPSLPAYKCTDQAPVTISPIFSTGSTNVSVDSIEAIQDWLLGCQYESDEALFGEADFWLHPTTFERLRSGDCETSPYGLGASCSC